MVLATHTEIVSGLCERDAKLEFYYLRCAVLQEPVSYLAFRKSPLGGKPGSIAAKWPSYLAGHRLDGIDEVRREGKERRGVALCST